MRWKNATVGTRISIGFGLVIVMLIIAGLVAYTGVEGIVNNAKQVIEGNKLDGLLAQKEVDHLNWAGKVSTLFIDKNATKLEVETDDHKCAFGKWLYGDGRKEAERAMPNLAPLFKEIEESHRKLHESAIAIGEAFCCVDHSLSAFLREKKVDHLAWISKLKDVLIDPSANSVSVETDPTKCGLGKWMASGDVEGLKKSDPQFAAALDAVVAPHRELHRGAGILASMLADGKHDEARLYFTRQIEPAADKTLQAIDSLIAWHDARIQRAQTAFSIYTNSTLPALHSVQRTLKQIREEAKKGILSDEGMLHEAVVTKRDLGIILGIAIPLAILFSILINRGITGNLRKVSDHLSEVAEQVASASNQISSASQMLAGGASEQAAAIEETAASIEEITSMTTQSAGNAHHANTLMVETRQIVGQANQSIGQLTESMEEISKSSEQTSKIIKTIDEIAFQTNLLALNAAVEAARAGEAGAGFAVVADEVRNLAMRAAEAAKSTESLIEGTVQKIHEGADLVRTTNEDFSRISATTGKMAELVDEIALAAKEQAEGINQISRAVSEMDKVTQQNSSSAEECAATAEEMSAQADQMQDSAHSLSDLIGSHGGGKTKSAPKPDKRSAPGAAMTGGLPTRIQRRAQTANGNGDARGNGKAIGKLLEKNHASVHDESDFMNF